jgi:hypothetical protein
MCVCMLHVRVHVLACSMYVCSTRWHVHVAIRVTVGVAYRMDVCIYLSISYRLDPAVLRLA